MTTSVIWQECFSERRCVHNPFGSDWCLSLSACVRVIRENSDYYVEIEARGQRLRYRMGSSCYTAFRWGIVTIRICIEPNGSNSVRIVVRGCLDIEIGRHCWVLKAFYPTWFAASDVSDDTLRDMDISQRTIDAIRDSKARPLDSEHYFSFEGEMSEDEIQKVLALPDDKG